MFAMLLHTVAWFQASTIDEVALSLMVAMFQPHVATSRALSVEFRGGLGLSENFRSQFSQTRKGPYPQSVSLFRHPESQHPLLLRSFQYQVKHHKPA